MSINPLRAGTAFGGLVGLAHAAWASLVAADQAQPLLDFILRLHFMKMAVTVQPFDAVRAAGLVATSAIGGFVLAALFAVLWNWTQQDRPHARRARTA
ncbi:MAG TPA: hypothetical protein VGH86_10680 [Phenylobacterium sp.]|jgi:hypothetical protein